jgi:hypothetical protein
VDRGFVRVDGTKPAPEVREDIRGKLGLGFGFSKSSGDLKVG